MFDDVGEAAGKAVAVVDDFGFRAAVEGVVLGEDAADVVVGLVAAPVWLASKLA